MEANFTARFTIIETMIKLQLYLKPDNHNGILLSILRDLLLIAMSKVKGKNRLELWMRTFILCLSLYSMNLNTNHFSFWDGDPWNIFEIVLKSLCTVFIILEMKRVVEESQISTYQHQNGVITNPPSFTKSKATKASNKATTTNTNNSNTNGRIMNRNGKLLHHDDDDTWTKSKNNKEEDDIDDDDLLTLSEVRDFYRGVPTLSSSNTSGNGRIIAEAKSLAFDKDLEILEEQLTYDKNISDDDKEYCNGFYGSIKKGTLRCKKGKSSVWIKISKSEQLSTTKRTKEYKNFITEFQILASLGFHENILQVLGSCTQHIAKGPFYVIFESCETGSLKSYMRSIRPQGYNSKAEGYSDPVLDDTLIQELQRWSYEIASGMNYIASNGITHGALSTDRIFLTSNRTIKLTEFGIAPYLPQFQTQSQALSPQSIYQSPTAAEINDLWPWRNLPKESLSCREFSSKSDVYSFGIVIWEILNMGQTPFQNFKEFSIEFLEHVGKQSKEPLLEFPDHILDRDILNSCLSCEKGCRPEFEEILLSMYKMTRAKRRKVSLL